jgi:hypothetical protein
MSRIPPAVRLLPMATWEFCNESERPWEWAEIQQKFFLDDLPFRHPDARYLHYRYGLSTPPGSVVLFQFRNAIVASACFLEGERFPEPDEHGYYGALHFDPKSIRVFEPAGPDVLSRIWPEFTAFTRVKQGLDPKRYPEFEAALKHVRTPKAYYSWELTRGSARRQ